MEHVDHILVVADDREIRELVGNYLKKNGLRVSLAADGRQMRTFLEGNAVDLIVLDIMMPGDDGLKLCRELRVSRHKATPVLMLTARNEETDRIVGLEMGADDYLTKPFSARELLARINAVLRRTRMLPPNLQISESSRLIGFGQLRWGAAPSCVAASRPAEIQRLYVDSAWHGHGIAQGMMASLLRFAAEGGADAAWLGVWEKNPRAIAFYAKAGFSVAGEHVFVLGSDPQRDLVLALRWD